MNIVDLVLILFLTLGAWNGFRRGLLESLAELIGNIVGFFTALKYYAALAAWLKVSFDLQMRLQTYFQEHLILPSAIKQIRLDKLPLFSPGSYLDKVNLPVSLKTQLTDYINSLEASLRMQGQLGDIIYQFLANILINAGAFLLIWFFVNFVVWLLVLTVKKLTENTIFSGINRMGGMVIGLLLSGFTLTILVGFISPVLQITNLAEPTLFAAVLKSMNESQLLPHFQKAFVYLAEQITALWL